jgi:tripartite-type tricarboxylate transporter receptor subunit TctC
MRIAHLVVCSVAVIAASCACAAEAPFPSRPIRLVVGTTPGSSPDLIARTVSKQAESYLGQTIVPDNRAGANGVIAAVIVAKAAPDGYTVLHTSPGFLLNAIVYWKVQYDLREFVPVTQIT